MSLLSSANFSYLIDFIELAFPINNYLLNLFEQNHSFNNQHSARIKNLNDRFFTFHSNLISFMAIPHTHSYIYIYSIYIYGQLKVCAHLTADDSKKVKFHISFPFFLALLLLRLLLLLFVASTNINDCEMIDFMEMNNNKNVCRERERKKKSLEWKKE